MAENKKDIVKESMVSIGEQLKNAREKRSITIDKVRKETRIHSTVLAALEEGRCDEILTRTYVKSFLHKYSHYLGLDSKGLLKEYDSLHPEEEPHPNVIAKYKTEGKGLEIIYRFIYSVSFVLLLIAFVSLVIFLGHRITPAPKKGRPHPAPRGLAARGKESRAARPKDNEMAQTSVPKRSPFRLVLKVKSPVLVEVKKDGVLLFKRRLAKGSVESFTANDKIELYVARAEAVELVLNDRTLGSPGKGTIKNLEVTSSGMRIK